MGRRKTRATSTDVLIHQANKKVVANMKSDDLFTIDRQGQSDGFSRRKQLRQMEKKRQLEEIKKIKNEKEQLKKVKNISVKKNKNFKNVTKHSKNSNATTTSSSFSLITEIELDKSKFPEKSERLFPASKPSKPFS